MEKIMSSNWLDADVDGGEIVLQTNQKDETLIHYSTFGLTDGYYTAFIYEKSPVRIHTEDTAVVSISTENELRINLMMIDANQQTVTCEDDSAVFLREKGSSNFEQYVVSNGIVTVPAGFDGEIYFPFRRNHETDMTDTLVMSGFIIVLPKESETGAIMKDVSYRDIAESGLDLNTLQIVGNQSVEIPETGEYCYQYKMQAKDQETNFSLLSDVSGVSMTKDGVLTVLPEAKEGIILITEKNSDNVNVTYRVELKQTWYASEEAKELQIHGISTENEVQSYQKQLVQWQKVSTKASYGISAVVLGIVCYLFCYRFVIRKK